VSDRLDLHPVVPDGVVRRAFAERTVVLDLRSGKYFGLNPTAERMLAALEASATVREALRTLREAFEPAPDALQDDLVALCGRLEALGLIELRATP
jgi:hypothetical protein